MKANLLLLTLVILVTGPSTAQRNITPTDMLTVTGKVKAIKHFSLTDLDSLPKVVIPDQVIYNQEGVTKDTLTKMSGVQLKSILASIELTYDKPKELNEFYFVIIASDGYTVVFSWNEIYNTEAGNHFYIVTDMNGKHLADMEQRIVFISTADLKARRRYIKALATIDIRQVE